MSARKAKKKAQQNEQARPEAEATWVLFLWWLAAGLVFWSFGYTTMRGSDLWWHLAGGRWMWEHGTVWVNDPFSYTVPGKTWLNDAWLSGMTLYLWAHWLTLESLAYWKWGLIVVTWLLLFRLGRRLSGDPTSSLLACILSIAVAAPFLDVRPQLYSFVAWVVVLDMCLARDRPSLWLPLVMVFWVNLHAGFFLGLVTLPILLFPYWLDATAEARRARRDTGSAGLVGAIGALGDGGASLSPRAILLLGLLSGAACLVNPNGLEVVTRPLLHAFDTDSPYRMLGEWLPPFRPGGIQSPMFPYGIAAFLAAALVSLASLWGLPNNRRRIAMGVPLFLGGLTLLMALQSRRFVPIFAITEVLVLAPALSRLCAPIARRFPVFVPPFAALVLGLWCMSSRPIASWAFDDLTAHDSFPIDTCEFIKANDLSGNTFAYYNWGGFVQLCTQGRMKVFIDGRAETVYEDQTFRDYMTVLGQRPGWERVIEDSGADFVLWPLNSGSVPRDLAASPNWRIVYKDIVSVLLARTNVELAAEMKPSADSPYRDVNLGVQELQAGKPAEATAQFEQALAKDEHFFPACMGLVRSRVLAGQFAEARAAADRCGTMTSDAGQIERLRSFIDVMQAKASQR